MVVISEYSTTVQSSNKKDGAPLQIPGSLLSLRDSGKLFMSDQGDQQQEMEANSFPRNKQYSLLEQFSVLPSIFPN